MIKTWLRFSLNVFIRKRQGKRPLGWRGALGSSSPALCAQTGPGAVPMGWQENWVLNHWWPLRHAQGPAVTASMTCNSQLF